MDESGIRTAFELAFTCTRRLARLVWARVGHNTPFPAIHWHTCGHGEGPAS